MALNYKTFLDILHQTVDIFVPLSFLHSNKPRLPKKLKSLLLQKNSYTSYQKTHLPSYLSIKELISYTKAYQNSILIL